MMKQEKKTLSYYRLRLEVYLKDYHPQLLGDETFIRERSEAAAKTYEEAFLQDNPIGIAESMAMEVLLRGLHFSPYQFIELSNKSSITNLQTKFPPNCRGNSLCFCWNTKMSKIPSTVTIRETTSMKSRNMTGSIPN